MNYYPFHIGDYATHTSHLDPLEDIAYRRLLDLYYTREAPLEGRPDQLARVIRMREHPDIVEQVLREFFEECDNGGENPAPVWRHSRCEEVLSKFRVMAEGGRKGAAKRWSKGGDDQAIAPPSDPLCQPITNNQNQKPKSSSLRSEEGKRKRASALVQAKPVDVSDGVWISYLAVRRAKRAPLTDLAMLANKREAAKAGLSLEEALTFCCEANWQAFNAEWWENRQQGSRKTESFYEREQQIKRKRWEEMTGRTWPEDGETGDVIDMQANTMLLGDKS